MAEGPSGDRVETAEERITRNAADLYANDQQFRDTAPREEIKAAIQDPSTDLAQALRTALTGYADRPALGQRSRELVTDPSTGRKSLRPLPEYDTISYRELDTRVAAIAAEWQQAADSPLHAGDFVAILGFSSTDYTTLDLTCLYLGAVSVPLQSGASVERMAPILAETGPRILASSIGSLDSAVDLLSKGTSVERLIVFDYRPEDDDQRDAFEAAVQRLAAAGSSVTVDTLATVLERGRALPPVPQFTPENGEDPLALLLYTSGSTGTPKGAEYTRGRVAEMWSPAEIPVVDISYMPMSHLSGRVSLARSLASGGITHFIAETDLSTLFEDISLTRPTSLNLVPRVCDMLFQRYQSELDRNTAAGGDPAATAADLQVEFRQNLLGGRVLFASCGSAPLSAEVQEFMESVLDLPLIIGYGSTEAGVVSFDGELQYPPVIDYALADVPELGYFRTDTPYPRGELLLKTQSMIPGYYKRPEVNAEVFDEDGFYKTGDIMAELAPGKLAYVDRRSNVLKLSQGEFVTVSRLEAIYVNSPLVRQIFVYGNSTRSYLLAVVVPPDDALESFGDDTAALKSTVLESLQQTAKDADVESYEIPRDVLIETVAFSRENGLLSEIGKLQRPKLKAHYGDQLEQLYAEHAEGRTNELRVLRQGSDDRPVIETVTRAAQALLGTSSNDLRPESHFTDLGGDSLSALSFSSLLQEIFDIEVPVSFVISPANDLRRLAEHIDSERRSGGTRPTFATVHGSDSTTISAGELTLDKFVDPATLAAADNLPAPSGAAQTVLLTGANGYLGRFLCLEWLERLAETGGTLICIVRGNDAEAARARLEKAFDSGDAELLQHFRDLAARNLEVLAGDIGDENLGLDEATWSRLARDVDRIVHPAALVNHVLPYNQLFGPNVVGTAELIRLALTDRIKPFVYLSTVGVASQGGPSVLREDADIRVIGSQRSIDESYANGYGNSKWAGEVLLREAHERYGLPTSVFRSDMILAHSRYTGQLNVPDLFTRLLFSLAVTGVAPNSFYETDAQGNRQRAHYDGLPADFTAEAITTLGEQATEGFHTFNVLNPHDDGISLDEFVDWMIEFGQPIKRIDDFDDWFARFEAALRGLPEQQQQHSLLPLLHAHQRQEPPVPGSAIPAERFHAAVREAKVGADKDIPHLSKSLIEKYVTDLQQLGLL